MTVRSAFPILYSSDVQASLGFHRDALGCGAGYVADPDGNPVQIAARGAATTTP